MRLRSTESSAATLVVEGKETTSSGRTFFDLPAELRNAIYEFVISETTLSLPSNIFNVPKKQKLIPLRRRKSFTPPVNGLLLASRQCRHEYLSVLLSSVSVLVEVKDFDFENLMRVSSGLGTFELQALQSNRHLTLLLNTRNCTTKGLTSLRRWLEYRRDKEESLPWKYEFPLDSLLPSTKMGRVRLLRELEYYADSISTFVVDLEEKVQPELQAVIEAFECKAGWLGDDVGWTGQRSKSVALARNVRGLAGGGIW